MSLLHDLGGWLALPLDEVRRSASAPLLLAGGLGFGALHALLPGHGKTLLAGRYALARSGATGLVLPLVDGMTLAATRVFLAFALVVGSVALADALGFALPLRMLQLVAGLALLAIAAHLVWPAGWPVRRPASAAARPDVRPTPLAASRRPIDASLLVLALTPEPMAIAVTSFGLAERNLRAAALVLTGLALGVGLTLGLAAALARAARGGGMLARLVPHAGTLVALALALTGALTIAEALSSH